MKNLNVNSHSEFNREQARLQRSQIAGYLLPLAFVVLYGSGFVAARQALLYAPPLTFLTVRFAIAACVAALCALATRARWPERRAAMHIAVAGLLTQGAFSVGAFVSIDLGVSPALSALIISLQPLLVGVLAGRLVRERVSLARWSGLAIGFVGVAFVLGTKLRLDSDVSVGVAWSVLGLLALTAGNLYQKRFCADMNVFAGGAIQSGMSTLVILVLAFAYETMTIQWTWQFTTALLYMSLGVSVGALTLLFIMIRCANVSRVVSVFYLVPLPAAVASPMLFGKPLDTTILIGVAVIFVGVILANWKPSTSQTISRFAGKKADGLDKSVLVPMKFTLQEEGDVPIIPWKQFATQGRRGVSIHTIYECGEPRRRLALMQLAPGSSAPTHRHTGYETIFVLAGSLHDDFGHHKTGELVVYPPDSEHCYTSPQGALLIVVLDAPTEQAHEQAAA